MLQTIRKSDGIRQVCHPNDDDIEKDDQGMLSLSDFSVKRAVQLGEAFYDGFGSKLLHTIATRSQSIHAESR